MSSPPPRSPSLKDGGNSSTDLDKPAPVQPAAAEDGDARDAAETKGKTPQRPPSSSSSDEEGAVSSDDGSAADASAQDPPLPNEAPPGGPPLPDEPVPQEADDGWDCQWDANTGSWFFCNRFTGLTQWDNPRVPSASSAGAAAGSGVPAPPENEQPAAGGYNPAIHGDYDPNAWYAKGGAEGHDGEQLGASTVDPYAATAAFNRFTGQFQTGDAGPGHHSDEAKSRRQMNAYFDVDAAANSHDGRSLKAERSGKKPSKSEVKAFKEKRRARKEEKRRAWLRD